MEKVRIKNGLLKNALEGILELAQKTTSPRMAFKLKSLIEKLQEQYKPYAEVRDGLVKEYGEKDEEGNLKFIGETANINIAPEGIEKFAELDETEGEPVTPLRLTELNTSFKEMSALQMFMLGPLVFDDFETEA